LNHGTLMKPFTGDLMILLELFTVVNPTFVIGVSMLSVIVSVI